MSIRALLRSRAIYAPNKSGPKGARESAGCLSALWQRVVRQTRTVVPPTRNGGPTSAPSGIPRDRPVVIHDNKSNRGPASAIRHVFTEPTDPPSMESQINTARRFDLPTSFKDVRGESGASSSESSRRSDFPSPDQDFYEKCTAAQLDAFTRFSIGEYSAENMFFLMACEKLLNLGTDSEQRKNLAKNMLAAFSDRGAPLEPNLDGSNKRKVTAALAALARGEIPEKLEEVFKDARANLLKSVGSDSYRRFRESLPA